MKLIYITIQKITSFKKLIKYIQKHEIHVTQKPNTFVFRAQPKLGPKETNKDQPKLEAEN